jgi:arylsulfatase A-like enzyme
MPSPSYLDMVFRIPSAARLLGSFEFEPAPENDSQAVEIYAQLLDEQAAELTLFRERANRRLGRSRRISFDLETWAGQLARLRLGVTGPGNGLLRWRDLRIDGADRVDPISALPPINRQVPTRSGRLGRPDVLVILLDAARADGFSPFGGTHPTPHTDRLAKNGTVYRQALSPSSWTGQSVPAILTGLFPDTLGVGPYGSRLPDEVTTLAELMAAAGYRTVLWSQHAVYGDYSGFARGFQEVHRSTQKDYESLPGSKDLMVDDQPTFAFVHLIPPHTPYEPPPPFQGAYSSWYTGEMSIDARHLNSYHRKSNPRTLSADDLRYARDRYLENVAFADELVGRMLAHYDRANRYEETLIVLLSDHGEAFMEHDRFLHGRFLYREFLHVPLVLKWPASVVGSSSTVFEPVSLVDLVPTLVDGLDLVGAEQGFQGRSLLPLAFDGLTPKRPLYAMTRGVGNRHLTPRPHVLLASNGWRFFYSPLLDQSELFRVDEDPLEAKNLATDLPLQALLLRQSLLSQMEWNRQLLKGASTEGELEELDPETIEQLKALGYLN